MCSFKKSFSKIKKKIKKSFSLFSILFFLFLKIMVLIELMRWKNHEVLCATYMKEDFFLKIITAQNTKGGVMLWY